MTYPLGPKHNPVLRRLYEVEGLTLRQIAERFGVSHQAVYDRLSRMGVSMRLRIVRRNAVDAEILHRLYVVSGLTIAEVAAELNVKPYFVSRELKHHGIPRRRTGTRPTLIANAKG